MNLSRIALANTKYFTHQLFYHLYYLFVLQIRDHIPDMLSRLSQISLSEFVDINRSLVVRYKFKFRIYHNWHKSLFAFTSKQKLINNLYFLFDFKRLKYFSKFTNIIFVVHFSWSFENNKGIYTTVELLYPRPLHTFELITKFLNLLAEST